MSTPSPTPPDATVDNEPAPSFPADERYEEIKQSDMHIADLQRMTMKELLDLANTAIKNLIEMQRNIIGSVLK